MNFSLAEEQQLLREALVRFIEKNCGFDKRRATMAGAAGWSRDTWKGLAELGVLGVLVPQEFGGYGGSTIDVAVVMEAMGEGLLLEPFTASSVLGASALVACANATQQAAILPALMSGDTVLAFAHGEDGSTPLGTTAAEAGNEYILHGAKRRVPHGAQADTLIISAMTAGSAALFLVPGDAAGLQRRDFRTIDGLRAADLALNGVRVPRAARLDGEADVPAAIELILDRAAAAVCAEAVGVMQKLQQQTLEYIKTRQQFGQPIGRFQVLQHRAADMYMLLELSRSMAYYGAMAAAEADAGRRRAGVSAAKAYIGRSGRLVAQSALQMHGGIGLTDELPASHYAKRLTMLDFWFGTRDDHLRRFLSSAPR